MYLPFYTEDMFLHYCPPLCWPSSCGSCTHVHRRGIPRARELRQGPRKMCVHPSVVIKHIHSLLITQINFVANYHWTSTLHIMDILLIVAL